MSAPTLRDLASRAGSLGQTARALGEAARAGRLGHAYLLHPAPGASATARELAIAIASLHLCPSGAADGTGCGRCRACGLVARENHPDLFRLGDPSARRIPVDAVRALLHALTLAPMEGAGRVAIVDPTEALGPEGANGLLKTLEEPPDGVLLLLVAERPSRLLPTVRSRCQRLRVAVTPSSATDPDVDRGPEPGATNSPPNEAARPQPDPAEPIEEASRRLLRFAGADPTDCAAEAHAALERAARADEAEVPVGERRRRATLAALDLVVARLARGVRARAPEGAPIFALGRAIERCQEAGRQIEANASPLLVLEVLAIDLRALVRTKRRP